MLKITLHDSPQAIRFQLEGKLVGPWVREMEQCWRTAESIRKQKALIIDLAEVTFIDSDGKELLETLAQAGAQFLATAPMTKAICGECANARASEPTKRGGRAVLPILLLLATAGTPRAQMKEPVRLTLKDAVTMALRQNPERADLGAEYRREPG